MMIETDLGANHIAVGPCPECVRAVQYVHERYSESGRPEYLRLDGFEYCECSTCIERGDWYRNEPVPGRPV